QLAMTVENTPPPARSIRSGGGCSRPHSRVEAQLSDIDVPNTVDKDLARPGHVGPFGQVLPFGREKLKTTVFAVGHVHGSLPIDRNAVGQAELTGVISRHTPREQQ